MTRTVRGDQIVVKPRNDVYTALVAVGCVALIVALVAMITQSNVVFGDGLFMPSGTTPSATVGGR